ncbi:MAG: glycosyltransferase, partial [Acidobacteriota bacterium]
MGTPEQGRLKVIIAGGGTGGHVYPGIAIAHELRRRDARTQVTFFGTARGLET